MIKILMNDGKYQEIKPTVFPDKTSQVWKLDLENLPETSGSARFLLGYKATTIVWNYENEAELFQLCQLIQLLYKSQIIIDMIRIPYLPYARQDKDITNESTFAKHTFIKTIRAFYRGPIYSYDVHSKDKDNEITNISPTVEISRSINSYEPNYIVYPDAGAYKRYNSSIEMFLSEKGIKVIVLDKNRDQLTGKIDGLRIDYKYTNESVIINQSIQSNVPKFLIVDDICDGGATFIYAAKALKENVARKCKIGLHVSHGIFSKGLTPLLDAGINSFFTTNSLKNMNDQFYDEYYEV